MQMSSPRMNQYFEFKEHAVQREVSNLVLVSDGEVKQCDCLK
jgi:hypothetical protein